jgi:hypothetical protein
MSWPEGSEAIDNSAELIDSREIIARIAWLDAELSDVDFGAIGDESDELWDQWHELEQLRALADQASGYGDWEYGETLISDDHFEAYAKELAEDIGAIDSDAKWPAYCIDWERAADELRQDYTSYDFGGQTYWGRS